jgi:hypothetical protein
MYVPEVVFNDCKTDYLRLQRPFRYDFDAYRGISPRLILDALYQMGDKDILSYSLRSGHTDGAFSQNTVVMINWVDTSLTFEDINWLLTTFENGGD